MATDPGRFIAGTEMELIPSGPGPESLATHHQRLGPLPALAPAQLIAELKVLTRDQDSLVQSQTRLVNQLTACLKAYYPVALELFGKLHQPTTLAFLQAFPTLEQARASLDLGFMLSFAGNVTYPKSQGIRDAAAFAPADRLLLETDSPYLAPLPHRGKRNEPALVAETAHFVAGLRGVSAPQLGNTTTANFRRFFRLG